MKTGGTSHLGTGAPAPATTLTNHRRQLGIASESEVAREMVHRGYRILERNHREPWGEMDLVCRNDREVVVVEVRSRDDPMGEDDALESIGAHKRRRVRRAAEIYLAGLPADFQEVRFFAAAVTWENGDPLVRVIEDAF